MMQKISVEKIEKLVKHVIKNLTKLDQHINIGLPRFSYSGRPCSVHKHENIEIV